MSKKVLVFTYRYPPFGGIGAVRMTCVTKYLPEHGWDPYVYTSDWNQENCRQYDPDFAVEVLPHVVHRAKLIPGTQAPDATSGQPNRGKLAKKLSRYRRGARELQNLRNWVREGKRVMPEIIRKNSGFDAILSTYPTTPALQLGDWTSRKFGIPWLVDFRDIIEESSTKLRWLWMRRERSFVQSSSAIMTVSEPLAEALRLRNHQPVSCVPNGFDPQAIDFESLKKNDSQHFFEIVYTGRLYPPGSPAREGPGLLFEALDQLAEERVIDLANIRVTFAGTPIDQLNQHLAGHQSESCIHAIEWLCRRDVYELQANATMLLSLGSRTMKGILTGKLFEYLQTRRPILSIPHDKEGIGAILKSTSSGVTAETVEEVSRHVLECYKRWMPHRRLDDCPPSPGLDQYNWKLGAGKVASILDKISRSNEVKSSEI